MEDAGNTLEADRVEDDCGDIEMLDVEEGELVKPGSTNDKGQASGDDSKGLTHEKESKNRRRRANKKKNKRKKGPYPDVTDINR